MPCLLCRARYCLKLPYISMPAASFLFSRFVSVNVCCTGTGRTGFIPVAPNNYPFYSSTDEVYTPVLQSDGGQLSGALAMVLLQAC
jgi:hypothetical protein